LLRKFYPPPAFNQFAAPERLAQDFGQNQPNQARSTSPPHSLRTSNSLSDVREAWVNHFSTKMAPSADYAADIALDRFGNAYVTGSSDNGPFEYDFLTLKYDPSGKQLWTARYNGEGNGDDYATAISVDSAGNVYVIGTSATPHALTYLVAIKYNTDGTEQWAIRLNDRNAYGSHPSALVVDPFGNVYITGWNSGWESDCLTVKYNSDGVEQWRAHYGNDFVNAASDLAVYHDGSVLVAGISYNQDRSGDDIVIIKYNASGLEQWTARYDGPAHSEDFPIAISLDAFGNVYVKGTSFGNDGVYHPLIKYNPAGAEQWVARLGPGAGSPGTNSALAIDDAGNIYVAAAEVQGYDYTTIKYDTNGAMQWTARYDSPYDFSAVSGLALDHAGNVLVTGFTEGDGTEDDYTTVKYDANGVQQWVARYNGPKNDYDNATGLAIDGDNNIFVTGGSYAADTGLDYATIKYNPAGQEQWIARFHQEGNSNDDPAAMTMDAAGNIYVTGSSAVANTGHDYVTIKYNREGSREWIARYDGPAHEYDAATAIAVDNAGNVYVAGSSEAAGADARMRRYATVKYNAAGIQQWVSRYAGTEDSQDIVRALAIDHRGNVYVTGSSIDPRPKEIGGASETYVTVKYNAEGVEQWVAQFKAQDVYYAPYNLSSYVTTLAVDGNSNVYITGRNQDNNNTFVLLKYDTKGVQQWMKVHELHFASLAPAGLAVDRKNNIYVAATGVASEGRESYMVVKYNPDGHEEWTAHYGVSEAGYDLAPTGLAIDVSGNIYVTGRGTQFDFAPFHDYITVKFNAFGMSQWAAHYNGPDNEQDYPSALAVDGLGNVYVTGVSFGVGTGDDFATVKYNTDGVEEWAVRYNSPDNTSDWATALVVDNWGDVNVTGKSGGYNSGYMTTIKYTQQENANAPAAYNLSQSFPNPFADLANIRFRLPSSGVVTLKIYDVLGQEVETLLNGDQRAGEYRLQWNPLNLPNGVYFYRLQAGDFVETKKLVLLR
jgi:uncharacterized delta-60 repeat protein